MKWWTKKWWKLEPMNELETVAFGASTAVLIGTTTVVILVELFT